MQSRSDATCGVQTKTTECRSEKKLSYSADYLPLLEKATTNLAFLKEFCENWQNNPQNNLAIFHFGTQWFCCGGLIH